ncbi:hypothetical protein KQ693_10900 [Thermus sp. PS18]|uniref:hypothetical protein n=1 Tax=Thermus sp. PS18 TaxID=2849039 RepID=UPI002264D2B1|nr:hypothetical protein [Thermus sp. PS18]UZX15120.1 hypothetical protein KQ693_10900 [Thermus sp. PS18]
MKAVKYHILSLFLLVGFVVGQQSYVGGSLGFFGQALNMGFHVGASLGGGKPEARVCLDATFVPSLVMLGLTSDTLFTVGTLDAPVKPYLGVGGNLWLLPGVGFGYGLHGTVGLRVPIAPTAFRGFVELQPVLVFLYGGGTGVGGLGYVLKAGVDFAR